MNAKSKGGRPPKFKSPEEMQKKIDDYFTQCEGKVLTDDEGNAVLDKYGNPVVVGAKPKTITGLALALGFTSRQSLLNYQAKPKFLDTIMRAKLRCEEYANCRLYDRDGARGAQFDLTVNYHWNEKVSEKPETENNLFEAIKESAQGIGEKMLQTEKEHNDEV